jgi:endonuclease YncB( thermonuclease family)
MTQQRIRLARIDAPELDGPRNPEAINALRRLNELVQGETVEILNCQKWPDRYGRLIAEIILRGVNVSNQLLDEGCVQLYDPYKRHLGRAVADAEWLRKFGGGARRGDLQETGDGASVV